MYYKGAQINNPSNHYSNDTSFSPEKKKVILEHLLITKNSTEQTKNYSHVPCKFFKQGNCSAGHSCPFSHSMDFKEANKRPCKYFKLGNCKFGNKCANSHILTNPTVISQSTITSSNSGTDTPSNTPFGYFPTSSTPQYKQFLTSVSSSSSSTEQPSPTQISMEEKDRLPRTPSNNNNSNDIMRNYLYQLPSRKQYQTSNQQNFPLTPPLSSSSSCSSTCSSSISDPSYQSPFVPRHFNTLYSNDNKTNYNTTPPTTTTPIIFNPTQEENKSYFPSDENNMNNYYFNYSSILKTLEEDDEEEEEEHNHYHHHHNFQNNNNNNNNPYLFLNQATHSQTSQNQHFRFDDL